MNEKNLEDFLQSQAQSKPSLRKTFLQVVEGKVSDKDDAPFVREELAFVENMITRQVTFLSSRLCDCGKLISQKNSLLGKCQFSGCNKYVCTECLRVCCRCGISYCAEHTKTYRDGEVYCLNCRPFKWAKIFFGIDAKSIGDKK